MENRSSLRLLLGLIVVAGFANADVTFQLLINKWYYLLETEWGSTEQPLYLALDLGSKDIWTYGEMCYIISSNCKLGTHNYYRGVNSTSYNFVNDNFTLSYNNIYQFNGSVIMTSAKDTMLIAGGNSQGSIDFGTVMNADWSLYKKVNMSGIYGIGLKSKTQMFGHLSNLLSNNGNNLTLVTNAKINENLALTASGQLVFGSLPTSSCSSTWTYAATQQPVSSQQLWEVTLQDFAYGNYSKNSLSGNTAIFSTLTSYIHVPPDVFTQIHARVPTVVYDYNFQHYLVECPRRFHFDDLSFTIGGQVFNITPIQYVRETPSLYCILKVRPNTGDNRWVLGFPFHIGHCEHYDFGNQKVGISVSTVSSR